MIRICAGSLEHLISDIRSGKYITKPVRRGRKPKYTPELIKKIASELCVQNETLRPAKSAIVEGNIEAIRTDNEQLPVVSVTTMSRYVKNDAVMDEVDIGPLSFTQVSVTGPQRTARRTSPFGSKGAANWIRTSTAASGGVRRRIPLGGWELLNACLGPEDKSVSERSKTVLFS